MAVCEICGSSGIGTRRAAAQGTTVDACRRCIVKLGLQETAPVRTAGGVSGGSGSVGPPKRSSGGYGGLGRSGRDIMVKGGMELAPDFDKRVQRARRDAGLDQRALASRLGERLNVVQRIERGIRPTDTILIKIERELSIELLSELQPETERPLGRSVDRVMTLGDLLDEQLRRD